MIQCKFRVSVFIAGMIAMCSLTTADAADATGAASPFAYPKARRSEQVDDYHGTKVADPYRWLEDVDSPETRAWIEAENKITNGFLDKIPAREKIRKRLTALWDYPKYGIPEMREDRFFFTR